MEIFKENMKKQNSSTIPLSGYFARFIISPVILVQNIFQIIYKRIIPTIILLSLIGFILILLYFYNLESQIVKSAAIHNAASLSTALTEFRKLYTSQVVAKVRKSNIPVIHNFTETDKAIPLPSTLSMMLGKSLTSQMNGGETKLYSAYPFPWREKTGGLKDQFAIDAWEQLLKNPSKPFYKFIEKDGKDSIRYAVADIMNSDCVNCHNSHPDSPKTDWKPGDLRGILEVSIPIENIAITTNKNFRETFILLLGVLVFAVLTIILAIKTLRHREREANILRRKAESANRSKSQFLANMSHELRTPMNGVIGVSDLMSYTELTDEQKKYNQMITDSAKSLLSILNDILDLSKIEVGELSVENTIFDLHKIINETVNFLSPIATEKGISLEATIDKNTARFVSGDAGRVAQVLRNLIGNAIKFTEEGGVKVIVTSKGEVNGLAKVRFEIKDTGIGVPEDSHEYIFDKFTQANNASTREFGGTGLGLAICKELVQIMGGKIGMTSIDGKGSTFWFSVPLKCHDDVENIIKQHEYDNSENRTENINYNAKILIAEDHPINQHMVKKLLSRFGFNNIDIVENGFEALEALKKADYDLVLMDCQMPKMDGYEATLKIRQNELSTGKHIPIIAMTANAMVGDKEKCINHTGMDDYISKPVAPDEFNNLGCKWLGVHTSYDVRDIINNEIRKKSSTIAKEKSPIDMSHLRKFTDGDIEEEKILFALFLEQAEESISMMQSALNSGNGEEWRQASHKFKGAAANLGAHKLAHYCLNAEKNHESSEYKKLDMLNAVKKELEIVRKFIG
jgi:signal transduction histidine kinase/CheY-like chemotaxis protein